MNDISRYVSVVKPRRPGDPSSLVVSEPGASMACREIRMMEPDGGALIVRLLEREAAKRDLLCDFKTLRSDTGGFYVEVVPNPLYDLSGMD